MKSILNSKNQIKTDEYLTVPGHHHIFAVGDINDSSSIKAAGGARHGGGTAGSIITSLLAGYDNGLVPSHRKESHLAMMLGTDYFVAGSNNFVTNDMNFGKRKFGDDLATTRVFDELRDLGRSRGRF